jgi:hypothetical protein
VGWRVEIMISIKYRFLLKNGNLIFENLGCPRPIGKKKETFRLAFTKAQTPVTCTGQYGKRLNKQYRYKKLDYS